MDPAKMQEIIRRKRTEESIRMDFEGTLHARVERYLQVKPHEIVPYTHFASPLAECSLLYRDGHYYGCIASVQAVTEALVKYMCKKKTVKPANSFEKNLDTLLKRDFISSELHDRMIEIWKDRDDYHHLNPSVEKDRQKLQHIALAKTSFLIQVISDIFAFSIVNGSLVPRDPIYWETNGPTANVYLSIE